MTNSSPNLTHTLRLNRLHHRFDGRPVIKDISLELGAGEVLCLVGPSGCGKTTLLRLVAGLERVQQGEITLDGQLMASEAYHQPPEERDIGLVFQDFALFPHMTLLDNVAFGLARLPKAERKPLALSMLERVGLADRAESYPHQLSGGQQQRVALARALAPRPRLLLLDEPFSNLDVRLRQRMRLDTLQLLKVSGIASILVTHDPDDAMFMADQIALLRDGELVQLGTPEQLYHQPKCPFAAEFFGDINRLHAEVKQGKVETAFGCIPAPELEEGSRALVLIRPEAIRLTENTGAPARVVESRSLGARALVNLTLESGEPLEAQLASDKLPAVGDEVKLQLDWRGVFVFKNA